jgi:Bacterial protein of unknown function (DUF937)
VTERATEKMMLCNRNQVYSSGFTRFWKSLQNFKECNTAIQRWPSFRYPFFAGNRRIAGRFLQKTAPLPRILDNGSQGINNSTRVMALFDQILGAIANPNQQGSPDQLGGIINTVQQLATSRGVDPATTQTALSVAGGYVRSALQQQRAQGGNVEGLVNQYAGTTPNAGAVQALFSPSQQQQVAQAISQATGLNAETVQSILPVIIPIALNFLKSGATAQTPQPGGAGGNPVLGAFLDADGDGDVDLGDTMSMAGRFLNQSR